jgi:tetratricopeptide (TPR) repeat protein
VAVAVLGAGIFFSAQSPSLPNGAGTAIVDASTYEAARARMSELALERMKAFDAGRPLSADDLAKVREASSILDRMVQFMPNVSGNYFFSAKAHRILGENAVAIERYRQCVFVAPNDAALRPQEAPLIKGAAAQANYELSGLLLQQNDRQGAFDAANDAVVAYPDTPDFLVARASALNELRRLPEAKRDLERALKVDPNHAAAQRLLRFVSKP